VLDAPILHASTPPKLLIAFAHCAKRCRWLCVARGPGTESCTPFLPRLTPAFQAPRQAAQDTDVPAAPPQSPPVALPVARPPSVAPALCTREFPQAALVPAETRQSLAAQRIIVVAFPANAFRWWQFLRRAPRQQPRLHFRMRHVMSRSHLAIPLSRFAEHPLLIRNVRFHRVGDEEV
jgi:hypothetical protein